MAIATRLSKSNSVGIKFLRKKTLISAKLSLPLLGQRRFFQSFVAVLSEFGTIKQHGFSQYLSFFFGKCIEVFAGIGASGGVLRAAFFALYK